MKHWKIITGLFLVTVALAAPLDTPTVEEQLEGKTRPQQVQIKADAIKRDFRAGQFTDTKYGNKIELDSINEIDGGVEVFVRAWKGNEQLGFGDGTVETERIRIFNPPIMVPDPAGNVVRPWTDDRGQTHELKYREDPLEALKETIAHTVHLVAKDGSKIEKGKIGRTTTTLFPDPNPETNTVDGRAVNGLTDNQTFATIRAANGDVTSDSTNTTNVCLNSGTNADTWSALCRGFALFKTSDIGAGQTVSAATFSIVVTAKTTTITDSYGVVGATTASNTAIAMADYQGTVANTTRYATDISGASMVADSATYNDFSFNATGISAVLVTSITKIGLRTKSDIDSVAPTYVSGGQAQIDWVNADTAGTTTDPKLTVVHAATPAATTKPILIQYL